MSGSVLNILRALLHFPKGLPWSLGALPFLDGRWVLAESPWFWPWDRLLLASLYAWEWACSQALGEFACGIWENLSRAGLLLCHCY